MSKVLTTFSGKYGDILWSLPTVREISRISGEPVDFACMPQYASLIDLLNEQEYIDKAYVLTDWQMLHSNFGDQPWNPPGHNGCLSGHECHAGKGYVHCWHLGYRQHPGHAMGGHEMQLIDYTAWQQGIKFRDNPLPFLSVSSMPDKAANTFIAVAFNEQYKELKERFMIAFSTPDMPEIVQLDKYNWLNATALLERALGYVGCRASNWVLANAVNANIFTYEPHPSRHLNGHLGFVFGCEYGKEITAPMVATPEQAARYAKDVVSHWIIQKEKEHEVTTPVAG